MSTETPVEDMKSQLTELSKKRNAIEIEVNSAMSRLNEAGVGMDTPLVDSEGFPRADLDIPAIREDRHKVITLSNDHKDLTRQMEILLHRLHAISRKEMPSSTAESEGLGESVAEARIADPIAVPSSSSKPFAKIDEISPNSPASSGGLLLGDEMVRFGHVTLQTPNYMTAVASALARAEDKEIEVEVLREGSKVVLKLKPQKWSGRGLLGCHLQPF